MEIPHEVLVWTFGGMDGALRSTNHYQNNMGYNLHCATNNKYLTWQTGMLSINLEYSASPQNKYHFSLPDGSEREIRSGEPVAMAIGGGEAYLYYGEQTVGINLKWAQKPQFEWRILGPGDLGEPIQVGSPCALVNVKVRPDPDFMVFLEKHMPKVVDLGWTTSPTWCESYGGAAIKAAETAMKLKAAMSLLAVI